MGVSFARSGHGAELRFQGSQFQACNRACFGQSLTGSGQVEQIFERFPFHRGLGLRR